jgi:hypothetical protein
VGGRAPPSSHATKSPPTDASVAPRRPTASAAADAEGELTSRWTQKPSGSRIADLFGKLRMARGELPVEPLERGELR